MTRELTARQREVLLLKANGNTNAQIAAWLNIREDVVAAILTVAYRRLGAANGIQAAAIALAVGEIGVHQIHVPDEQKDIAA